MKTITVKASRNYDIIVGIGILDNLTAHLPCCTPGQKAVIVSDSNVWPLYGDQISKQLMDAGFQAYHFVFEAGEQRKNADTYLSAVNYLASIRFTRSDCLIALGGGVTGDMTGFIAATYLRGVSYIQIPTSLLAMVDSSVGGKTAIDLSTGKNLIGAFYQPELVLCDISVLRTLPDEFFRDGCAEIIKYGILYDSKLFSHLEQKGLCFDREYVISRCIELKRDVVCKDEFDRGERQKLNLGHTIGHGIEAKSNFQIPHGQAVAVGMAIIARSAAIMQYCSDTVKTRICAIIELFGFNQNCAYSADELFDGALSDKKRSGNKLNVIIPEQIGQCAIVTVPIAEFHGIIEAGL